MLKIIYELRNVKVELKLKIITNLKKFKKFTKWLKNTKVIQNWSKNHKFKLKKSKLIQKKI